MKLLPVNLAYQTPPLNTKSNEARAQHYYSATSEATEHLYALLRLLSMVETSDPQRFDIEEVVMVMRGTGRLGAAIADTLASDIAAFSDCYQHAVSDCRKSSTSENDRFQVLAQRFARLTPEKRARAEILVAMLERELEHLSQEDEE